jgi:hypothetical protein
LMRSIDARNGSRPPVARRRARSRYSRWAPYQGMSSRSPHSCSGRCLGSRMRRHTSRRASLGRHKHRPYTPDPAHSCSRNGRNGTRRSRGRRIRRHMRSALQRTCRGTRRPRRPGSPRMRPCSFRSGRDRRSDPYRPRCTRFRRRTGTRTPRPRPHLASPPRYPLPRLPNQSPQTPVRDWPASHGRRRPNKKVPPTHKQNSTGARSLHLTLLPQHSCPCPRGSATTGHESVAQRGEVYALRKP